MEKTTKNFSFTKQIFQKKRFRKPRKNTQNPKNRLHIKINKTFIIKGNFLAHFLNLVKIRPKKIFGKQIFEKF